MCRFSNADLPFAGLPRELNVAILRLLPPHRLARISLVGRGANDLAHLVDDERRNAFALLEGLLASLPPDDAITYVWRNIRRCEAALRHPADALPDFDEIVATTGTLLATLHEQRGGEYDPRLWQGLYSKYAYLRRFMTRRFDDAIDWRGP